MPVKSRQLDRPQDLQQQASIRPPGCQERLSKCRWYCQLPMLRRGLTGRSKIASHQEASAARAVQKPQPPWWSEMVRHGAWYWPLLCKVQYSHNGGNSHGCRQEDTPGLSVRHMKNHRLKHRGTLGIGRMARKGWFGLAMSSYPSGQPYPCAAGPCHTATGGPRTSWRAGSRYPPRSRTPKIVSFSHRLPAGCPHPGRPAAACSASHRRRIISFLLPFTSA